MKSLFPKTQTLIAYLIFKFQFAQLKFEFPETQMLISCNELEIRISWSALQMQISRNSDPAFLKYNLYNRVFQITTPISWYPDRNFLKLWFAFSCTTDPILVKLRSTPHVYIFAGLAC